MTTLIYKSSHTLLTLMSMYFSSSKADLQNHTFDVIFFFFIFSLQVEQKFAGMDQTTIDPKRRGAPGVDRDSIRASVLDEAVIVCSSSCNESLTDFEFYYNLLKIIAPVAF
ncbi:hypothetical protein Sjap_023963 [Stephania japonica]|uniref:Uncharacterized protein n=1 Tax=Stephania japonica TaxID=461633 RepID=A0AAP0ECK4_9MAGN